MSSADQLEQTLIRAIDRFAMRHAPDVGEVLTALMRVFARTVAEQYCNDARRRKRTLDELSRAVPEMAAAIEIAIASDAIGPALGDVH
jgi:hypothetical protein